MKNVLMISNHFYPDNRMATQRTAKLAKYLPEYGWNPLILCTRWTAENCATYDPAMEEDFASSNVVAALPCERAGHGRASGFARMVSLISQPRLLTRKTVDRVVAYFRPERTPVHFYNDALSVLPPHSTRESY